MFRDTTQSIESVMTYWQAPETNTTAANAAAAPVFGQDEIGAVWHVYREIARRIPRDSYTRHASTLGNALR